MIFYEMLLLVVNGGVEGNRTPVLKQPGP